MRGRDSGEEDTLVAWLEANGASEVSRIARALPQSLRAELDPEDVLQDALVRALEQFVRLAARGNSGPLRVPSVLARWLRVVIRRTLVDHLRSGSRLKRDRRWLASLESFALPPGQGPLEHSVDRRTPSVHACLIATETAARLDDALGLLPPRQRSAFVLVAVDGASYAQAAQQLHLDLAAVRDHVRRARTSLAASLERTGKWLPRAPVE